MTFLWIVALVEFCCAVYFYVQWAKAQREIDELSADVFQRGLDITELENLLDDSDDDVERVSRFESMLSTIIEKLENLMADFNDLKAEQDTTGVKVSSLKADVEALLAKLAAVPAAGMTAEQQTALDDAVARAKAINDSLSAVDAEVNPAPAA